MHDHTTCCLLAGMVVDGGVLQTPVCFANKFVLPTVHMCMVVKLRFPQGRIVMIDDDFTEKLHPPAASI